MSLKTSVGGRDSDSFITVAEADAFIAKGPDDTAEWSALTTAGKEYRLRLAAQAIGMLPWRGYQTYCGQNLCWPRRVDGEHLCCPCEVKEAQAFVAYSVIHRGLSNRPSSVTEEETGDRVSNVSMVSGLLQIAFAGTPVKGGTLLDQIIRSAQFPVYLKLKRFLSQVRIWSTPETDDEDYPQCSTTTTTSTSTTTTSSSSTSTTL